MQADEEGHGVDAADREPELQGRQGGPQVRQQARPPRHQGPRPLQEAQVNPPALPHPPAGGGPPPPPSAAAAAAAACSVLSGGAGPAVLARHRGRVSWCHRPARLEAPAQSLGVPAPQARRCRPPPQLPPPAAAAAPRRRCRPPPQLGATAEPSPLVNHAAAGCHSATAERPVASAPRLPSSDMLAARRFARPGPGKMKRGGTGTL